MNHEPYYTKEVVDLKMEAIGTRFDSQDQMLGRILQQTTKHNGRMTRVEKIILVFGTIIGVLLIVNGSSFIQFLEILFK